MPELGFSLSPLLVPRLLKIGGVRSLASPSFSASNPDRHHKEGDQQQKHDEKKVHLLNTKLS